MEGGCSADASCSLAWALLALHADAAAGLPAVIHLGAGEHTLDAAPFDFDALICASEVRLIGGPGGAALRASGSNAPVLRVRAGAPRLILLDLLLYSPLAIEGGELSMSNCTFSKSSADLGGALRLSGGALTAEGTSFMGCQARRGGAAHVSGGSARFSGCRFEGCSASEVQGGGALLVEGGSVVLRQATHLTSNQAAGTLESIFLSAGASLVYQLPAPLGHWIDSLGQDHVALIAGQAYGDYPHACAAGLFGDSEDFEAQSTALCSGLCPAGSVCGAKATVEPRACELGGFCPEGSPATRPCASGRFGNETGLASADGCHGCPPGTSCGVGATEPVPCSPGTFAANGSSAFCSQCPEQTYQPASGATNCIGCASGYYCPAGSFTQVPALCSEGSYLPVGAIYSSNADCEPCIVGSWCVGGQSPPKLCSVGSFSREMGLGSCTECSPGYYQNEQGSTACKVCTKASYCSGQGSSAPIACPGGEPHHAPIPPLVCKERTHGAAA